MIENEIYTLEKVAEKLDVSERYIRDQISNGDLKAFKRGRRFYILHTDLVNFVQSGNDAKDTISVKDGTPKKSKAE